MNQQPQRQAKADRQNLARELAVDFAAELERIIAITAIYVNNCGFFKELATERRNVAVREKRFSEVMPIMQELPIELDRVSKSVADALIKATGSPVGMPIEALARFSEIATILRVIRRERFHFGRLTESLDKQLLRLSADEINSISREAQLGMLEITQAWLRLSIFISES